MVIILKFYLTSQKPLFFAKEGFFEVFFPSKFQQKKIVSHWSRKLKTLDHFKISQSLSQVLSPFRKKKLLDSDRSRVQKGYLTKLLHHASPLTQRYDENPQICWNGSLGTWLDFFASVFRFAIICTVVACKTTLARTLPLTYQLFASKNVGEIEIICKHILVGKFILWCFDLVIRRRKRFKYVVKKKLSGPFELELVEGIRQSVWVKFR